MDLWYIWNLFVNLAQGMGLIFDFQVCVSQWLEMPLWSQTPLHRVCIVFLGTGFTLAFTFPILSGTCRRLGGGHGGPPISPPHWCFPVGYFFCVNFSVSFSCAPCRTLILSVWVWGSFFLLLGCWLGCLTHAVFLGLLQSPAASATLSSFLSLFLYFWSFPLFLQCFLLDFDLNSPLASYFW